MNRTARYISAVVFATLTVLLLCAAYTSESLRRADRTCTGVEVVIKDSLKNSFVTRADVLQTLRKQYGECKGRKVDSLDLVRIEAITDARSAAKKSEAYLTKDGVLHIEITQRKPIVRFQKGNTGFYADEEGVIFPLQSTYTAHVPVIDGQIPLRMDAGMKGRPATKKEQEWTSRIINLVKYMEADGRWNENIVQISVLEGGELVMVPRHGKERFLFGQPVGIEQKFSKMERYWSAIVPEKGENWYSTVDLRFDGRIVCRK